MILNINERIDTRAGSGNIEKLFHGSSSYGYRIGIDWKVNSQSVSGNSSNVTATVYIRTTGSGVSISSSASKAVSITINGTKYTSTCTVGIGVNTKKNLLSKTVTVAHNSDGSKTCSFACALDINVTLSGTYYSKITHEGSGTFDKINLNTAPVWVSGGRVTIKNGSTILTDQADGTENAVKFPENVGSLNISWSGATDANGDAITYELFEQVDNGSWVSIYTGTGKSLTRNIGSGASTQGKMYDYYVTAKDSKGVSASGSQNGTQVQKNTLNGSTLASSSSIASSTTSIAFTWNAGSNTDSSAVKYDLTASGVTIYRATDLTATSLSVAIVDSAPSSGAYILKSDLKTKFASSNYNGTLSFTLTTKNNYGSTKTSSKSITVDLRATPTPATPTINKNTNSTAYHTVKTTGVSYFVPDGSKTIRISWSGGSDYLGTALGYDVQVKIGSGSYETKFSNLSTTYCDLVLPKQTASQSFSVRVITKTSYNYTSYKDTTAETLHYYNQPSVDLVSMNRTSTAVTVQVKLNANTSIPNVNFTTRSYTGLSSGTLTNVKTAQPISASGLTATSKYSWTISVIDDVGLYTTAVTKVIEVPAYTPLFSVREKGVGVKAIPDGTADFMVGGTISTTSLKVNGKSLLDLTYPVGAIYMSVNSTNPSSLFGGTWVAWGTGRVPVAIDTSQTEFNTVEKTGGAKTHTLSVSEMPSHTHVQNSHNHTQNAHTHVQNSHNHTQNSHNHTQNAHSHGTRYKGFSGVSSSTSGFFMLRRNDSADSYDGTDTDGAISATATNKATTATNNATTATNQNTTATNNATTATNQNTGGGGAHNNLQPYITCYMWKRTA